MVYLHDGISTAAQHRDPSLLSPPELSLEGQIFFLGVLLAFSLWMNEKSSSKFTLCGALPEAR